ncbi:MAG: bacterial Ig-like domain-containing protein [Coriobacteriales bacterium]|nr:bacterial Ig-like domain-containing protein [Coriobacteriales bacterium]
MSSQNHRSHPLPCPQALSVPRALSAFGRLMVAFLLMFALVPAPAIFASDPETPAPSAAASGINTSETNAPNASESNSEAPTGETSASEVDPGETSTSETNAEVNTGETNTPEAGEQPQLDAGLALGPDDASQTEWADSANLEATADAAAELVATAAPNPTSANIFISYQADSSGFWIARQKFEVASDLSEQYGYTDSYAGTTVTALDAIVAAHIPIFGDDPEDIHAALEVSDDGWIMNFMDAGSNMIYIVNDALAGVAAGDYPLSDWSLVELVSLQEDWGMDVRAWFEQDDSRVDRVQVAAGEKLSLSLYGIFAYVWGEWGAWDDIIDSTDIVTVELDPDSGVGYFSDPVAVSNEWGEFSVSFDTPGTYILSATGDGNSEWLPVISPWLFVEVYDAEEPPPAQPADSTGLTIASKPTQTRYAVGDTLKLNGLSVSVVYANGSFIRLALDDLTASPADGDILNTAGSMEVELAYQDFTTSFLVRVYQTLPEPGSIEDVAANTADTINAQADPFSFGDEWQVFTLARLDSLTDAQVDAYLNKLEQSIRTAYNENAGKLDPNKPTENERVILALLALGVDPTDFAGMDLVAPLQDLEWVCSPGANSAASALLALDGGGFDPQVLSQAGLFWDLDSLNLDLDNPTTLREGLVAWLLDNTVGNGGWAYVGGTAADPDTTAMVLQALAPYFNVGYPTVDVAVNAALSELSALQDAHTAAFISWGTPSPESAAQVIIALNALGRSIYDDRFVKNGFTLYDALLDWYDPESGGFISPWTPGAINAYSTQQGLMALASLVRTQAGEEAVGLFNFSDVQKRSFTPKKEQQKEEEYFEQEQEQEVIQTLTTGANPASFVVVDTTTAEEPIQPLAANATAALPTDKAIAAEAEPLAEEQVDNAPLLVASIVGIAVGVIGLGACALWFFRLRPGVRPVP